MSLSDEQLARIFPGDSEMARRMRAFDWSTSDLGPPQQWPANLRTALNLCLTTRFPMLLWWGPQLTMLYNDAYITFLSDAKHPRALGRPGRECWSEVWDTIGPMLDGVLKSGDATWPEDVRLIMSRHLPREEVYVRFTYSPILSLDGSRVEGVFTPCTETTEQVVGARRLDTLRKLGVRGPAVNNVEDACSAAIEVLTDNPFDLPFAAVYLLEKQHARLAAATSELQPACLPPRISLSGDPAGPWPLAAMARTNEAMEVDLVALATSLPGVPLGEPARRALLLPIGSATGGMTGVLIAAISPQRPLDTGYRTFLELTARHIGTAIADARTLENERARAEALAQLDRAKTEFFSNVSHEFRTPLTLMLGPLEEAMSRAPEPVRESLGVVQRNGERLLKLVNTLLDFARIEAGRANARYQQTDLVELTADLASSFRAACERAGLQLRVQAPDEPLWAWIDRDLWEKIVLNLLSNAVKYTLAGEIVVSIEQLEDRMRLRVADTGVGIPASSRARVFERFHRVQDGRGRSHEGSGIGLALVQELVKLHGGSIGVESEVDRGSTFTVDLPLGYEHLPPEHLVRSPDAESRSRQSHPYVQEAMRWLAVPKAPETVALPAGLQRARVLVADDNADLRHYVQRLLEPEHEVVTASDGAEALALARASRPDLVVTDVMMPRLDGFGLMRALRDDAALESVPILMLSARAGDEARIEGREAGADDYLVKPFSARDLRSRVSSLLAGEAVRSQAFASLREYSAQIAALLDHVPVGALLIDADFVVQQANPVALPVFGDLGAAGIVGRDFGELMHRLWDKPFAERVVSIFRHTLDTGEPYATPETSERRRDRGVVEYYEWRVDRIPMPDGRLGLVCYFRDISRQVLARKELEASHAALRDVDERKSAFIATLSHELRNPLAPLRNGLEILRRVEDPTALERVRSMMDRQLTHMVRLIDDLLDVSRISRGKVELQLGRIELAQALQHALEASRPFIEAAGHTLRVSLPTEPIVVDADMTRLAQVFINLLNNAAKFTPHGGTITVRVHVVDGQARVHIADTGLGIEPEMQRQVFEMFAQVQRAQGGLGIGLALAKGLMQMHGGDIVVRSGGRGQGSEFTVSMPAVVGPHGLAAAEGLDVDASPAAQRRVLVADDNRDSARSLGIILQMQGHKTAVAFDGEEALALAERFRPDVMLLDIGMPKRDGYEVARAVRATDWGQDVTLVALTGWGQPEDRRKTQSVGFDHHLLKPVDTLRVQELLRDAPVSRWPSLDDEALPRTATQAQAQAARKGSSFTS